MKNFHGMEIPMSTEMYFLSVGYEWLDEASYQMIKSDKSLEYQIRGVDVDSNGHIDLYLIRATQRGYKKPNSNSGCRLRTGNPDNGRQFRNKLKEISHTAYKSCVFPLGLFFVSN